MAYSEFHYPDVVGELGLTQTFAPLFAGVPPVTPNLVVAALMEVTVPLGTSAHTEIARSIWLVGPLLADFWGRYDGTIGLYAGSELYADPTAGLTGVCDFALTRSPQQAGVIGPPAVVLIEAKRDSIPNGLGQCIATMVGAQRFNRAAGQDIDPVYGCVTTGQLWRFLRLTGTTVTLDRTEYTLEQTDRLLGILTHIIGPVPVAAAA